MADDAIDAHEDLQSITDKAELLAELRGVQVPVASSWPALGWWLLGTALLLALIGMVIHSVVKKRRAQDAWRIEALMELHHLKQSLSNADASDRHALLKRASVLLRRVMMHLDGRESVANLTNDRWLDALDGHAAVQPLESSLRPLLTDAPYRTVSFCCGCSALSQACRDELTISLR